MHRCCRAAGLRRESYGQTRDKTRSAKCITGLCLHSGYAACEFSPVEAEKHPKTAKMKPDTEAVTKAGMIDPAEYTLTQQYCGSQSEPAISNSKNLDFNFFNFFSTSLRLLFFNFSPLLFIFIFTSSYSVLDTGLPRREDLISRLWVLCHASTGPRQPLPLHLSSYEHTFHTHCFNHQALSSRLYRLDLIKALLDCRDHGSSDDSARRYAPRRLCYIGIHTNYDHQASSPSGMPTVFLSSSPCRP